MANRQSPLAPIPSPAIVAQDAVRRFPRWALLLLCGVYVASGFVGREPWRNADMEGFSALLHWMGASPLAWFVARAGAAGLLGLTLICTWYATYYLARRDAAQPVPFAFGGEAMPTDYARALADGALLALIACLGLAKLAHETTFALLQLSSVACVFFGLAAARYHPIQSRIAIIFGTLGLGCALRGLQFTGGDWSSPLGWQQIAHMLIWFTWPAWVLMALTLYKWRRHWLNPRPALHVALPLGFVLFFLILLPCVDKKENWFLSALPCLATLSAFALPTLRRGMKSLIDLFTLIFFSGCALIIWIVWIAMQTGVPPQPAANVAKLVPGFSPSFSEWTFGLALLATAAWSFLFFWRIGKHRPAIWMSMVLPASGAALCWLLLLSLWLPLLDYARSYQPLMLDVQKYLGDKPYDGSCIQVQGLEANQQAALRYYTGRIILPMHGDQTCQWLIVNNAEFVHAPSHAQLQNWHLAGHIQRLAHGRENWLLYRRKVN